MKGIKGRLYLGSLWIEDASTWPNAAAGGNIKWYAQIANGEHQGGNLASVAGVAFAKVLDPHPPVRAKIAAAIAAHISILLYG